MLIRPPPRLTNQNSTTKYIESDLWTWLKALSVGFISLNFQDNFQSFVVKDLFIAAGTEVSIPNEFRTRYQGLIPLGRTIIRQVGNANIVDGDTPWTVDLLTLKNPSDNDVTVSVLFFN